MDLQDVAAIAHQWHQRGEGEAVPIGPLPGVVVLQRARPTPLSATLYEPVVCLILQGAKEVLLGERVYALGPGALLVVSHEVPVSARITAARPEVPYLAVVLPLEVALLRSLYDEVGAARVGLGDGQGGAPALAATTADPRLIDTVGRYLSLAADGVEAKVLAPAVRRELHFRLLMAPNGAPLRGLLRHDSHASLVAAAIARIREGYRSPIAVPDLARAVGMSPSALHKHFRAVTATTPLQFQKDLRLLEARRLLLGGQHVVSDVAYAVGYESPSQFSREYARKFGSPPSADLRAARALPPPVGAPAPGPSAPARGGPAGSG